MAVSAFSLAFIELPYSYIRYQPEKQNYLRCIILVYDNFVDKATLI